MKTKYKDGRQIKAKVDRDKISKMRQKYRQNVRAARQRTFPIKATFYPHSNRVVVKGKITRNRVVKFEDMDGKKLGQVRTHHITGSFRFPIAYYPGYSIKSRLKLHIQYFGSIIIPVKMAKPRAK